MKNKEDIKTIDRVFSKCLDVIYSCENRDQLDGALKMSENFYKMFNDGYKFHILTENVFDKLYYIIEKERKDKGRVD